MARRFNIPKIKESSITLMNMLMKAKGLENPRIRELHEAFKQLDKADQQEIESCVQILANHSRFDGKNFGPVAAFELLGAIGEKLAWIPSRPSPAELERE